jgi:hypothetical protein
VDLVLARDAAGKPEISRPLDMQSSIDNSSASRSGSCSGKRLP